MLPDSFSVVAPDHRFNRPYLIRVRVRIEMLILLKNLYDLFLFFSFGRFRMSHSL
jgi:hypothetical protein